MLPAAGWGEKTGTFTNVNRTVHLSEKAVEPPGEARSDLDIFLDVRRTRWASPTGTAHPLIAWRTPEEAFEAWQAASRGRPVDYTGSDLRQAARTAAASRGPSTTSTRTAPTGSTPTASSPPTPTTARPTATTCVTGGAVTETSTGPWHPPGARSSRARRTPRRTRSPSEEYPLLYTTGRTVYQFHTRTKTGRSGQLNEAAPDAWVELSPADAEQLGIAEGDVVRVESPRGAIEVPARVGRGHAGRGVRAVPLRHTGTPTASTPHRDAARQANELTMTVWDPVSKQPYFKTAACRVTKVGTGDGPSPAPTTAASAPADDGRASDRGRPAHGQPACSPGVPKTPRYAPSTARATGGPDAAPLDLRALADHSEQTLADSLRAVARATRRRLTCTTPATAWPDGATSTVRRCGRVAGVRRAGRRIAGTRTSALGGLEQYPGGRDRAPARPAGPAPPRQLGAQHLDPDRPGRPGTA